MTKRLLVTGLAALLLIALAVPAMAQGGKVSTSIYGGWAFPVGNDPLEGRDGDSSPDSSSMDNTWTLGAEVAYRFPVGLSLGVGIGYLSLDCKAARSGSGEADWATLNLTPLYLLVRYDHNVAGDLQWYGEAGVAYAFAGADEGDAMKAMAHALGTSASLSADDSTMFMVGTGVSYFVSQPVSLNLGVRYWWGEFDSDLSLDGWGVVAKDRFEAQNVQVLLGITYWFDL